ncbi:hypothetical protein ACIP5Y_01170 [Nocardia sp. NPDC088792]|uniref:hypothetical protein n=1 Tax=Nocardia sp. NPDC088792 TaxID=3364332 RepID=UPI0037FDAE8F
MVIRHTEDTIRSTVTPEWAERVSDTGYRLSWLPELVLTRRQAVAGLRMDEILSDPAYVDDAVAIARARMYAHEVGIILEQAIIRLFMSVSARQGEAGDAAAGPALHHSNNQFSTSRGDLAPA